MKYYLALYRFSFFIRNDLYIVDVLLIGLAIAGYIVFIFLSLSGILRLAALILNRVVFSNTKRCFYSLR
jgi:ABC-type cobalamin transport system permease subunit